MENEGFSPAPEEMGMNEKGDEKETISPEDYKRTLEEINKPMTREQQAELLRKVLEKQPPEGVSIDEWKEEVATEVQNNLGVSLQR